MHGSLRRPCWPELQRLEMRVHSDYSGLEVVLAFGLALVMFVGLAASWSFENTTANVLTIPPLVFFLLAVYATRLAKFVYFEIDPSRDCVYSHKVSLFGSHRKETYQLSGFQGVVSYLSNPSPGVNSGALYNYVELLSKHGGKGLVIASFNTVRSDRKFLSLPAHSESQKAKEVRLFFAESCGMIDLGFAGYRRAREQLLPSDTECDG